MPSICHAAHVTYCDAYMKIRKVTKYQCSYEALWYMNGNNQCTDDINTETNDGHLQDDK